MTKSKINQIRFGITDDNGHMAATWSISNPKTKSDIYVSCRELNGMIKTSLHESGSWHAGYSKEATEKYFEAKENKYIEIWEKPQPITPGVTLALRIVTPYSAITKPVGNISKEFTWIPNCATGYATEIDLIITTENTNLNGWPGKNSMGTQLIGTIQLANGEKAWLVYWTIPMPDFTKLSSIKMKLLKNKTTDDLKTESLRAIIFGDKSDGSRTIYDLAVTSKLTQ